MNEKIGFVGTGRMGANMARRLKDCGYALTAVYDAQGLLTRVDGMGSVSAYFSGMTGEHPFALL